MDEQNEDKGKRITVTDLWMKQTALTSDFNTVQRDVNDLKTRMAPIDQGNGESVKSRLNALETIVYGFRKWLYGVVVVGILGSGSTVTNLLIHRASTAIAAPAASPALDIEALKADLLRAISEQAKTPVSEPHAVRRIRHKPIDPPSTGLIDSTKNFPRIP